MYRRNSSERNGRYSCLFVVVVLFLSAWTPSPFSLSRLRATSEQFGVYCSLPKRQKSRSCLIKVSASLREVPNWTMLPARSPWIDGTHHSRCGKTVRPYYEDRAVQLSKPVKCLQAVITELRATHYRFQHETAWEPSHDVRLSGG